MRSGRLARCVELVCLSAIYCLSQVYQAHPLAVGIWKVGRDPLVGRILQIWGHLNRPCEDERRLNLVVELVVIGEIEEKRVKACCAFCLSVSQAGVELAQVLISVEHSPSQD